MEGPEGRVGSPRALRADYCITFPHGLPLVCLLNPKKVWKLSGHCRGVAGNVQSSQSSWISAHPPVLSDLLAKVSLLQSELHSAFPGIPPPSHSDGAFEQGFSTLHLQRCMILILCNRGQLEATWMPNHWEQAT